MAQQKFPSHNAAQGRRRIIPSAHGSFNIA
jgi:hypothetical protein